MGPPNRQSFLGDQPCRIRFQSLPSQRRVITQSNRYAWILQIRPPSLNGNHVVAMPQGLRQIQVLSVAGRVTGRQMTPVAVDLVRAIRKDLD